MTVPQPYPPRFAEALRRAALFSRLLGIAPARSTHAADAALLVARTEADENLVIAALLHDIAENTIDDSRVAAVRSWFGERASRVVAWCGEHGTHPMPPFRGLDEYRVAELMCATRDVLIVAAADTAVAYRALSDAMTRGRVDAVASDATADATMWFAAEVSLVLRDRLRGHPLAAEVTDAAASLRASLARRMPLNRAG